MLRIRKAVEHTLTRYGKYSVPSYLPPLAWQGPSISQPIKAKAKDTVSQYHTLLLPPILRAGIYTRSRIFPTVLHGKADLRICYRILRLCLRSTSSHYATGCTHDACPSYSGGSYCVTEKSPLMGGKYDRCNLRCLPVLGSSPRLWGKFLVSASDRFMVGVIPTYVGKN